MMQVIFKKKYYKLDLHYQAKTLIEIISNSSFLAWYNLSKFCFDLTRPATYLRCDQLGESATLKANGVCPLYNMFHQRHAAKYSFS